MLYNSIVGQLLPTALVCAYAMIYRKPFEDLAFELFLPLKSLMLALDHFNTLVPEVSVAEVNALTENQEHGLAPVSSVVVESPHRCVS